MSEISTGPAGSVAGLWRYPVKSMQGEAVTEAVVGPVGLEGDRAWAVVDVGDGKVASAKHPRKWGRLLECSARSDAAGDVDVTLPDGTAVRAGDPAADEALSDLLGRPVRLRRAGEVGRDYEGVWPEFEGVAPESFYAETRIGSVDDGALIGLQLAHLAPGTFVDLAPLHVVTTSSLAALDALEPGLEADVRRFRPNLLIDWPDVGFVEDAWAGLDVHAGHRGLVVRGLIPTMRCIMPTLAQPALRAQPEVLRALAREHRREALGGMWACLGLYAAVGRPGAVAVGDPVTVADAAGAP